MLISVQSLRAIAAWMVVMHHVMQIFYDSRGTDWFSVLFSRYGSIGVDIFFVISGFVIYVSTSERKISSFHFFINRIIRIVPAYWIYTLLTALLVINFENLIPFTQIEAWFLAKSLTFVPAINPGGVWYFPLLTVGWTLNFEMMFYLIFSLALLVPGNYRLPYVLVAMMVLQMVMHRLSPAWKFYDDVRIYEFFFGIVVAATYRSLWLKKLGLLPSIMVFFVAVTVIYSAYGTRGLSGGSQLLQVSIPCAAIVAVFVAQEEHFRKLAFLTRLGDWSYSTYLLHVIVISIGFRMMLVFELPTITSILVTLAAILGMSYLSFIYIELKGSAFLKDRFARQEPSK
jgi:peptidoglycan/LPS O-acetylase OafA/YrhL